MGNIPSVSAGWRISEENFFKPVSDWWSSLKLRASVGSLGNQQVDYYAYLQTITSDNQFSYTFDGEGKAYYAKISNPISSGLTWETVTTYNVGLDMSFLDSGFRSRQIITIRKRRFAVECYVGTEHGVLVRLSECRIGFQLRT